ncbi:MAG: DUF418 domain-containing protein, partial [Nocardioides sp.]
MLKDASPKVSPSGTEASPANSEASRQSAGRLRELDLLRGFTLLMIFTVNASGYFSDAVIGAATGSTPASSPVDFLSAVFTSLTPMRSYLIFSFVFGYGFIVWLTRREIDRATMRRRSLALVGLGVAHGLLLFEFDILLTYGVLGYLLYKIQGRLTDRLLVLWAAIIVTGVSALLLVIVSALLVYFDGTIPLGDLGGDVGASGYQGLADGPFNAWASGRFSTWWTGQSGIAVGQWWGVFTMFLLGAYAGRNNLLAHSPQRDRLTKTILRVGAPVVLVVLVAGTYLLLAGGGGGESSASGGVPTEIGASALLVAAVPGLTVLSSLTYIVGFVWLGDRICDTAFGKAIAAAGSMSLTGYMLQSAVIMVVFTWPGLGLMNEIAPGWGYLGVIGLWVVQCFVAAQWLTRFRLGP